MINKAVLNILYKQIIERTPSRTAIRRGQKILKNEKDQSAENLFLTFALFLFDDKVDESIKHLEKIIDLPESKMNNFPEINYTKKIKLLLRYMQKNDDISTRRVIKICVDIIRIYLWSINKII